MNKDELDVSTIEDLISAFDQGDIDLDKFLNGVSLEEEIMAFDINYEKMIIGNIHKALEPINFIKFCEEFSFYFTDDNGFLSASQNVRMSERKKFTDRIIPWAEEHGMTNTFLHEGFMNIIETECFENESEQVKCTCKEDLAKMLVDFYNQLKTDDILTSVVIKHLGPEEVALDLRFKLR